MKPHQCHRHAERSGRGCECEGVADGEHHGAQCSAASGPDPPRPEAVGATPAGSWASARSRIDRVMSRWRHRRAEAAARPAPPRRSAAEQSSEIAQRGRQERRQDQFHLRLDGLSPLRRTRPRHARSLAIADQVAVGKASRPPTLCVDMRLDPVADLGAATKSVVTWQSSAAARCLAAGRAIRRVAQGHQAPWAPPRALACCPGCAGRPRGAVGVAVKNRPL